MCDLPAWPALGNQEPERKRGVSKKLARPPDPYSNSRSAEFLSPCRPLFI